MTNKHYNWMTPEEAARELKEGEFIWILNTDNEIIAGQVTTLSSNEDVFFVIGEECFNYFKNCYYKAFCRAIVPEVPSE